MKWSYRLLRVAGIDIRVHVTFVLALLLGASEFVGDYGGRGAVFGVCLVCALFACVTLHELGHGLVAQRFGVSVREIVLLPIGGMARLAREPSRPLHELLVAVAGPLVNVVIAITLFFVLGLSPARLLDPAYVEQLPALLEPPHPRALLGWLLLGNIGIALFNMIPAFPMDGGRVLRAILSFGLGKSRATAVATRVGQFLAIGMMLLAIFVLNQPMLALVGLLIFFAAGQEKVLGRAGEVLDDLTAGDVCDPNAVALGPSDDLGDVVDHALRSGQTLFPIVYGTELLGIVIREEALEAATRLGLRASLREVLRRDLPVVDAKTPVLDVRTVFSDTGLPVVVTDERRFLGVVGSEDLARIVALGARLGAAGIRRPRAVAVPAGTVTASRWPPAADG
jgi:Zn-dependent protease/predicted transcriptional regulator